MCQQITQECDVTSVAGLEDILHIQSLEGNHAEHFRNTQATTPTTLATTKNTLKFWSNALTTT